MRNKIAKYVAYLLVMQMFLYTLPTFAEEHEIEDNNTFDAAAEVLDDGEDESAGESEYENIKALYDESAPAQLSSVCVDISNYFDRYAFLSVNNLNNPESAFNNVGMYIEDVLESEFYDTERNAFIIEDIVLNADVRADEKTAASTSKSEMSCELSDGIYEELYILGGLHKAGADSLNIDLYYTDSEEPVRITVDNLKSTNSQDGIIKARGVNKKALISNVFSIDIYKAEIDNTRMLKKIVIPKQSANFAVYAITLTMDSGAAERIAVEKIENAIADLNDDLGIDDIDAIENINSMLSSASEFGYNVDGILENEKYKNALMRYDELRALKDIYEKIKAFPYNMEYLSESAVNEVTDLINEAESLGYDISLITNYHRYTDALEYFKNIQPVSIPLDLSEYYTAARFFSSNGSYTNGQAGNAGTFYRPDFINLSYWKESADWENSDKNTLTFGGIDFNLYVPDCKANNSDTQYCVLQTSRTAGATSSTEKKEPFTHIDVDDAQYMSVEFLANASDSYDIGNRNGVVPKYILVKLNYSDGTNEMVKSKALPLFTTASASDSVILTTRCDTKTDETHLQSKGSIAHVTIKTNSAKILESMDIANGWWDFEVDDMNEYVTDENGEYIAFCTKGLGIHLNTDTNRYEYKRNENGEYEILAASTVGEYTKVSSSGMSQYSAAIYAITMVKAYKDYFSNGAQVLTELDSKLGYCIINENGDISEITSEGIALFDEMQNIIENLDESDFLASLTNYNRVSKRLPRYTGASVENDFYNVRAKLKFTTKMADVGKFLSVTKNGEAFYNYKVITEENEAYVVFDNDYDYDSEYVINVTTDASSAYSDKLKLISPVKFKFINPVITEVVGLKLTDEKGRAVSDLAGTQSSAYNCELYLRNVNAPDELDCTVLVCLYNEDGRMISSKKCTGVLSRGQSLHVNELLTSDGNKNNSLKIYCLDSILKMNTVYKTISK